MIEIVEERILERIAETLMGELSCALIEIEENSDDAIRLPPLRYVGLESKIPAGTGFPKAFVSLEVGSCSLKDRVIKNSLFTVSLRLLLADEKVIWRYFTAIEKVITARRLECSRCLLEKKTNSGMLKIVITL